MSEQPDREAGRLAPVVSSEDVVDGLRRTAASRVVRLPRPSSRDGSPVVLRPGMDVFRSARMGALAAAYHRRRGGSAPVVWVWHRAEAGGPVELLSAGSLVIPPAAGTRPVEPGGLWSRLARLRAWSPLLVAAADEPPEPPDQSPGRAGVEEFLELAAWETSLVGVWEEAFAVLVIATPALDEDRLTDAERQLAANLKTAGGPESLVGRQMRHRQQELRRGRVEGLWYVRAAVGAATEDAVLQLAGLASAGVDLSELAYRLQPTEHLGSLHDAITTWPAVPAQHRLTAELDQRLCSSQLVAELTRPPSIELPGIRLVATPTFDQTIDDQPDTPTKTESDAAGDDNASTPLEGRVELGSVLDTRLRPVGPLTLGLESLNRHTGVFGATGAGKSQTVRGLLTELTGAGVPWLVVEPAKAEYAAMGARLHHRWPDGPPAGGAPVVVRPGDPGDAPVGIDPMRPAPGFALQTHIDLLRALFLASFEPVEPFPQILASALTRVYERFGWNIATGQPRRGWQPIYPTLADLESTALQVIDEIGYSKEIRDNVTGFVRVRLSSLRLGTTGRFLCGGHQLDIATLLGRNTVIELEDVGDDQDKAFLMGIVLIALTEHHRVTTATHPARSRLRHVTVFEEAHRLLRAAQPGADTASQAVEMFAALLAEVRAYGEGVIVAEQIPSKLIPDVIKNTAVKILHRLPAADDRDTVGATMNLTDEQSRYVVTLPPGQAAVHADGMDHPILAAMPDGTRHETPTTQHTRATVEAPADGTSLDSVDGRAVVAPALERRLAPPETLARPVFGRCGTDYGKAGRQPLNMLAAGSELANETAELTAWVELTVVAYLTGQTRPATFEGLTDLYWQRRDITTVAIIQLVDEAVANRAPHLAERVHPADLARHTAHVLTRTAARQQIEPEHEPPRQHQLRAPAFAWDGYVASATTLAAQHPDDPHMHSELACHLELQRQARAAHGLHLLLYGSLHAPGPLETAWGLHRTDPEWPATTQAAAHRYNAAWIPNYLDHAHRTGTHTIAHDEAELLQGEAR